MVAVVKRSLSAVALFISVTQSVTAFAAPANMLIYIHPQEYKHPIKLWHFYTDYWYQQGPIIEEMAKVMFGAVFGEVGMCGVVNEARSLVWLQPKMYYNPHMTTYYGEVRASVYTSNGEPLKTYSGEAKKTGFLDIMPQDRINEVYQASLEDLIEKMKEDDSLMQLVNNGEINVNAGGACAIVPNFPPPKLIELDYLIKGVH